MLNNTKMGDLIQHRASKQRGVILDRHEQSNCAGSYIYYVSWGGNDKEWIVEEALQDYIEVPPISKKLCRCGKH